MASGAAKLLRSLFVRLGVEVEGDDKIDRVNEAMDATKSLAADVGRVLTRAALGATAFAGALVAQGVATARSAEEAIRQARALGISVERYQELRSVFHQLNADETDLADALATITDRVLDADDGMKSMAEDLALVGLEADELRSLRPDQIFARLADAVANTADENAGLTATVRLLGDDTGRKLMPVLREGSAQLEAMAAEAHELGVVMSGEDVEASAAFAHSSRRLWLVIGGLRNELGAALAPVLTSVANRMTDWVKANREMIRSRIRDFVDGLRDGLVRLQAVLAVVDGFVRGRIGGWGTVLAGVAGAAGLGGLLAIGGRLYTWLQAVKPLWTALAGAMGVTSTTLAGFVGLIAGILANIALMALLVDDLRVAIRGGDSVLGDWIAKWESSDTATGTFARTVRNALQVLRLLGRTTTLVAQGVLWLAEVALQMLADAWEDSILDEALSNTIDGITTGLQNMAAAALIVLDVLNRMGAAQLDEIGGALRDFETGGFSLRTTGQLVGSPLAAFGEGLSAVLGDRAPGGGVSRTTTVNLTQNISGAGDPLAVAAATDRQARLAVGGGER